MRKTVLCFILLISIAAANAQELITNKDVIAMKTSKVAEDLIVSKINTGNCDFDLTAEGLGGLKMAKLSDKTIKLMITASSEKPMLTNDDIVAMKTAKIADDIVKHLIVNSPHDFNISTDGLIKLNAAKISKSVLKDMMSNPTDIKDRGTNRNQTFSNNSARTNNSKTSSSADVKQQDTSNEPTGKVVKYEDLEKTKAFFKLYDAYVASDGSVYQKGDKIQLKSPSVGRAFQYVYEMRGLSNKNYLDARYSNRQLEIVFIKVEDAGTDLFASKKLKMAQITTRGIGGVLSTIYIDVENAIASGEIKSKVISENEAIATIKRAKDKYELGLTTKQEYEAVVNEMKKYIK
ncbi:MAG: hypothetical protein QM594_14700 [Niabella sp.]